MIKNIYQKIEIFPIQTPPKNILKKKMLSDLFEGNDKWNSYSNHEDNWVYFLHVSEIISLLKTRLNFEKVKEEYDFQINSLDLYSLEQKKITKCMYEHPFLHILYSFIFYLQEIWVQHLKVQYFNRDFQFLNESIHFAGEDEIINEIITLWDQYASIPQIPYDLHPSFMIYAAMNQELMSTVYLRLGDTPAKSIFLLCYIYDFDMNGEKGLHNSWKETHNKPMQKLPQQYYLKPILEIQSLNRVTINQALVQLKLTDWKFHKKSLLYFTIDMSTLSISDYISFAEDLINNLHEPIELENEFNRYFSNKLNWDLISGDYMKKVIQNVTLYFLLMQVKDPKKAIKSIELNNIYTHFLINAKKIQEFPRIKNSPHYFFIQFDLFKISNYFNSIYNSYQENVKNVRNKWVHFGNINLNYVDHLELLDKIEIIQSSLLMHFKDSKKISEFLIKENNPFNEFEDYEDEEYDEECNDDEDPGDEDKYIDFDEDYYENEINTEIDTEFYSMDSIKILIWDYDEEFIKLFFDILDNNVEITTLETYLVSKATPDAIFLLFSLFIKYDIDKRYDYNYRYCGKSVQHHPEKPELSLNYLKSFLRPIFYHKTKFNKKTMKKNKIFINHLRFEKMWEYIVRIGLKNNILIDWIDYCNKNNLKELFDELIQKAYQLIENFSEITRFPPEFTENARKYLLQRIFIGKLSRFDFEENYGHYFDKY